MTSKQLVKKPTPSPPAPPRDFRNRNAAVRESPKLPQNPTHEPLRNPFKTPNLSDAKSLFNSIAATSRIPLDLKFHNYVLQSYASIADVDDTVKLFHHILNLNLISRRSILRFLLFFICLPISSMALPHHLDQHHLQDSKNFREFFGIDGQISPELGFDDQSQHPPYIPPFHVAGLAPGPVMQIDGSDEFDWNYGVEPRRERIIKEQDFLENNNNSQISSIDFWQNRSVSTGLGLSLDNARIASSDGSTLLSFVGDDIDRELQRQDADIDRYLKIQGDQLRNAILDKIQRGQRKTVSLMEERVVSKLREKDEELEMINRKNKELEVRMEQLTMEAEAWKQCAKYNENMIAALNYNLERAQGRPRDSIEGCGDSEVDDTASCFNGRNNNNNAAKTMMMCRFCGVREVCMLLLPCKHMCLCKECERKLSSCPLCQSSKFLGMEVYM